MLAIFAEWGLTFAWLVAGAFIGTLLGRTWAASSHAARQPNRDSSQNLPEELQEAPYALVDPYKSTCRSFAE
jgi:hypothetical protein